MRYEQEAKKQGPYRSRNGAVFGVCRGLAEYMDFSVLGMRLIFLVFTFFTFPAPLIVYIIAAFAMKLEPVLPLESEEDMEFYHSYASSRSMALHRLKRTYDSLERRIERIETIVTAPAYDWDRRLDE